MPLSFIESAAKANAKRLLRENLAGAFPTKVSSHDDRAPRLAAKEQILGSAKRVKSR